jgi:hypothetical protein
MIEGLKHLCEEHVSTSISCNSLHALMENAKRLRAKELEKRCLMFFQRNVEEMFAGEAMMGMPQESLVEILCKDFYVNELLVFQTVVRWIKRRRRDLLEQDQKEQVPSLMELARPVMKYVRFVSMTVEDLETKVVPEKIVDPELLLEVMFFKLQFGYTAPPSDSHDYPGAKDSNGQSIKYFLRRRRSKWKTPADFDTEAEYSAYLQEILRPGMLVLALNSFEQVQKDDIGTFVQSNQGVPPCQVKWQKYGNTYWLYFRDLQLID